MCGGRGARQREWCISSDEGVGGFCGEVEVVWLLEGRFVRGVGAVQEESIYENSIIDITGVVAVRVYEKIDLFVRDKSRPLAFPTETKSSKTSRTPVHWLEYLLFDSIYILPVWYQTAAPVS